MVKGEMAMNQGDGVEKESKDTGRDGKVFFRRRQHILRQDVRHGNRGLQRIAMRERVAQILTVSKGIGKKVGHSSNEETRPSLGPVSELVKEEWTNKFWSSAAQHMGRQKKAGAPAFLTITPPPNVPSTGSAPRKDKRLPCR